ncbi:MAG: hypothetical protein MAG431_00811 [Chloroflexi bacterium]|nr:hypothetical protein [Chloroflexota bacterium]
MAFLQSIKAPLFVFDLAVHYLMLIGIVWSVAKPKQLIWPPPKKWSWQNIVTWVCFAIAFILNGVFVFLDWNSWMIPEYVRFFVGVPLALIGFSLFLWGFTILGIKNTSGLKGGFIYSGPYRYTRNPQYLGDIFLFVGIILISNSRYLMVVNSLLALIFLITPLAEEIWLEEQYGEEYKDYKRATTRFL